MTLVISQSGISPETAVIDSDDQLMRAYCRGDGGAFDALYGRYKRPLYGYINRNCGDTRVVDELFQDVWLRVIVASRKYRAAGRFRSWIFTLTHNCIVDHYRRADREPMPHTTLVESAADHSPEGDAELAARIARVVAALPLEQRQAFCLREESGFSIAEIAEIQGVGVEAAKSRLRYAYQKMRIQLKTDET